MIRQRGVDDGKMAAPCDKLNAGDAEDALEPAGGDDHRSRIRSRAGSWLRKRGRCRGVELHVALDLLHHLVNVAIEHGDGTETLEVGKSFGAISCTPAPLRVDHP